MARTSIASAFALTSLLSVAASAQKPSDADLVAAAEAFARQLGPPDSEVFARAFRRALEAGYALDEPQRGRSKSVRAQAAGIESDARYRANLAAMVGPSTDKIWGGRHAKPGDFPDVVAIRGGGAICSGTLIAPRVVLTAAHCHCGDVNSEVLFGASTGDAATVRREVLRSEAWIGCDKNERGRPCHRPAEGGRADRAASVGADSLDRSGARRPSGRIRPDRRSLGRAGGDRPLVAILDAQFSPPTPGEGDILDKHVWPPRRDLSKPFREAAVRLSAQLKLIPGPATLGAELPESNYKLTRYHVYVWCEGRVPEGEDSVGADSATATTPQGPEPQESGLSPLSHALLTALREQPEGTYRSWIERTRAGMTGMPSGALVLQGPGEWPLLQRGADDLLFVLHQADRRQSNLEVALALSESRRAAWSQPGDRLTDAALRVALAEEKRAWAATGTANDRVVDSINALFGAAVVEMGALQAERATLRDEKLMESYLYWMTRARDEGQGNPDAALNFLVEQDFQDLASRMMVDRLVNVTQRAISRSAEDRLARTRTLLRHFDDAEGMQWIQDYRNRVESWGVEAQRASGEPRPITAREEPPRPAPEN